MRIEYTIFQFLEQHVKEGSSLLLALSGGPDSLSLAHLLLECQKRISFTLEVAHIDHNARADSAKEATILKEWALEHHVEFHQTKLEEGILKNKEAAFRDKRYEYFISLFKKKKYQALLVAHHQNDLEETVLKRILEGAAFENLAPLKEVSYFNGMEIWRPLLTHPKSDILEYSKNRALKPFTDPTNLDGSNLRSKMRKKIIPGLEREFGKNIRSNLAALSNLSRSFESYMDEKINVDAFLTHSHLGLYYDLSDSEFHSFELLYGLKKGLKKRDIHLNRAELQIAVEWVLDKSTQKKCVKGSRTLHFDRGRIFILPTHVDLPEEKICLEEGTHFFGPWTIKVEKGQTIKKSGDQSWENIFRNEGEVMLQLPLGEYFVKKGDLKSDRLFFGKRLMKLLQSQKVPGCLIPLLPVIESNQEIVGEFFTGKRISNSENTSLNIYLSCKKD